MDTDNNQPDIAPLLKWEVFFPNPLGGFRRMVMDGPSMTEVLKKLGDDAGMVTAIMPLDFGFELPPGLAVMKINELIKTGSVSICQADEDGVTLFTESPGVASVFYQGATLCECLANMVAGTTFGRPQTGLFQPTPD